MMHREIQTILEQLPHTPGVYNFLNEQGEVIYVGKAKDLKKRVSSYFNRKSYDSAKLRILISKTVDLKYIEVNTESDALLLENNLIKKLKPRYNVLLKDDKTYPWICVRNEPFPRIFSTRKLINDGSKYFGPYTSGVLLKTVIELIKSMYPLRNCNLILTKENIERKKFKACLEYQIGNCKAPCIGNQSEQEYSENVNSILEILRGNIQVVNKILKQKMQEASREYKFESAQFYKLRLEILDRFQAKTTIVNPRNKDLDVFSIVNKTTSAYVNYIKIINGSIVQSHNLELKRGMDETEDDLLGFSIVEIRKRMNSRSREIIVPFVPDFKIDGCKYLVPSRGDKLKLYDLSHRNAKAYALERETIAEKQNPKQRENRILTTVQNDLKLKNVPIHIECFDNSNLQGTNPVAACVVFRFGKPSKREYRHFNIKTVEGPDDFASMKEIVFRRYKRLLDEGENLPQLIVIDGGKGQLSSAYSALKELGIEQKVNTIGIAKKLEEIFSPFDPIPLYLDKNSETLRIIQHLRNEAHRFGIKHHRNRRSKKASTSSLDSIKGVGEKTKLTLFKEFKSLESIKSATAEDLEKAIGKSKSKVVFDYFQNKKT